MSRLRLLAMCIAIGVDCLAPPAFAGVSISPVVLEIDSPRKAIAVKVTNNGELPVTFQADVLTWTQELGMDRMESSDELLVIPPIVEVAPSASQIFRVMLRNRSASPTERTYRVILEEISPKKAASDGQPSVAFRVTHSLPVLIAPSGNVKTAVRWSSCPDTSQSQPKNPAATPRGAAVASVDACVRVFNAGNRRIKVQTLTIHGNGWQQTLPVNDGGVNVLAGTEREWRIPLSSGQSGPIHGLSVRTARNETLQAEARDN